MRSLFHAAAAFALMASPALAQGPTANAAAPDPAKSVAVDEAYLGRCQAAVSKELCACVITVADATIADPDERKVFYDFMMGDVEKAKAARADFTPERNMSLNKSLQRADILLGDQCDKLKPAPKEPAGDAPAPK